MEIKAKINMEYKDSKDAEVSFNTLEVDNEGFVESEINGSILSFNPMEWACMTAVWP